jgi:hypothetical protein
MLWFAGHGRALLQATSSSGTNFRPLALRDDRLDPLNNFNHYYGGYDIKSKHYWAVREQSLLSRFRGLWFCNVCLKFCGDGSL